MSLIEALRACRRHWWVPVLIAAVAMAAVFAMTPTTKAAAPEYKAKAIMIVNPSSNQSGAVNLQEAALETTVGAVPKIAAAKLHYGGDPAVLAGEVNVNNTPAVGTLTVEVDGPDGPRDAQVANAFASALNQSLTQTAVSNYQAQVASVESHLNTLQQQINQYNGKPDPVSQAKLGSAEDQYRLAYDQFQQLAAQGQPQATFNVLQKAVPVPDQAVHAPMSRVSRLVVAGIVGLLIGAAIAILLALLRPRIQDRNDAERQFGTLVLAEVPKLSRTQRRQYSLHNNDPRLASFREAYRMLRTAILLIGAPHPDGDVVEAAEQLVAGPQVILVTSPLPGDGKSTTVANLAVAMAESGRRVLIGNADFRAPQVHLSFGLEPGPGLTDALTAEPGSTELTQLVQPTGVPGVSLLHAGKAVDSPAELIATKGAEILHQARALADVVLLDTAPMLVVSDASELLPVVDAVVMVARVGQTTRDSARRSAELLERAAIPLLGVVLVGGESATASYYGGRYGYGGPVTQRFVPARLRRQRSREVVRVTSGNQSAAPAPPATAEPEDNGSAPLASGSGSASGTGSD